jgi:hypothetical protein
MLMTDFFLFGLLVCTVYSVTHFTRDPLACISSVIHYIFTELNVERRKCAFYVQYIFSGTSTVFEVILQK